MQCDDYDLGRCRSCTLMGTSYSTQLANKERAVAAALGTHAAGARWLPAITSPESHFRNKAKLVVGGRAGAPTLGILDAQGRGVDLRGCGLYEPGLSAAFDPLHRVLVNIGIEPYDVPARRGELKYVIVTHSPDGEHLLRFVVRSRDGLHRIRSALPRLQDAIPSARVVTVNLHPEHKAVLEGDTEVPLTARRRLPMRLPGATLLLGPRAFFQTNTGVATALYAQAARWADHLSPAVVHDLYCGVGGFALHLAAPGRRTVGVETSTEAVSAATESARLVEAEVVVVEGDATSDAPPGPPADLVVVNPPRRGIGPGLASTLEASGAGHVVYSSCNVDTLSRDLTAMPSLRVSEVRVADMFPQTRHVETIVLLERH
ncbi:methyltransferase domain-containing protein [Phycicoccus sp. CSK15P-2]|uniref:methyltransferase domain-containing protein n=1 Tax=Phycicoccus sp. CSK15P-2 TaxID=2807627 RepID=UPI0019522DCB|nr:methyltransferase domain-containing protein [Phycicoccus sp. CSK15P-2]MBM6405769.1 methyltransferase domain-containing protein [Phycicoccus sp. CSK15P-2]